MMNSPAGRGENLTIQQKGLILIAVPLLFQLAFIGLLIKMQQDRAQDQRWAIHTRDVMAQAEAIRSQVLEADSSIRGLVITRDALFTQAYAQALQPLPAALVRLQRLVRDNPAQQARARQIVTQAIELSGWLAETKRLVQAGNTAAAAGRVESLAGNRLLSGLRQAVEGFLAREEQLDRARLAALQQSGRQQEALLAGGAAFSIVLALAMVLTFSRGISQRLDILTSNARRLAEGKELAAPLAGADEIGQLDRVFHRMAATLAERDRENELFIYSVSHDLRSPLVNLQGFSQELHLGCQELRALMEQGDLPPAVRQRALRLLDRDVPESIHFIQTAVSRLATIIDALLRLSRAGRVEYSRQPVDVDAVVGRVVEALRATLTERGAQVTRQALPPAWGDAAAVEQIFGNLISNAVHYLDPDRPGHIEVGCRPEAEEEQPAPLRTYYVQDNGLGIPEAYQPKLFLAFQRFHPSRAPGEGIGLALTRRAVERHGGRIWVESREGVGSTFFVSLPAPPREGGA